MSMRRPDPQLQRAWRSKPPRSQRAVQGALAVVASVAVAAAGALLVRSCGGDGDESAPAVLPPLSSTTTTSTTTTTTVAVVRTYEIQSGDSLFAIAQRFGVTVAALLEVNGIEDPDRIEAGQILTLPPNASLTPITTTTTTTTAVDDDAPVETTLAP